MIQCGAWSRISELAVFLPLSYRFSEYFIPKHGDLEGWVQEGWRVLLRPLPSAAAPKAHTFPVAVGWVGLVLQAPGPAEN